MLCPRRKFLKVEGATAAFAVILRAQATTSLTQQKHGSSYELYAISAADLRKL